MGGVYLATYTAKYPAALDALPESGYLAPVVRSAVLGAIIGTEAKVLDGRWEARTSGQELWRRVQTGSEAVTFSKTGGVWSAHEGDAPASAERVVRGGYATPVTLTDLNEMLADGVISVDDRDAAIAAAGVTA